MEEGTPPGCSRVELCARMAPSVLVMEERGVHPPIYAQVLMEAVGVNGSQVAWIETTRQLPGFMVMLEGKPSPCHCVVESPDAIDLYACARAADYNAYFLPASWALVPFPPLGVTTSGRAAPYPAHTLLLSRPFLFLVRCGHDLSKLAIWGGGSRRGDHHHRLAFMSEHVKHCPFCVVRAP